MRTRRVGRVRVRGLTLLELLIALSLLTIVILGASSIDLFSRTHLINSDRRAKIQNEASYVLEHMAKNIVKAIGDETDAPGSRPVDTSNISGDAAIKVWIDSNSNARRDLSDSRIAYRFRSSEIQFCPQCNNAPCTLCNPSSWVSLSNKMNSTNFSTCYTPPDNYLTIEIIACDNPGETCGSLDNPSITLRNKVQMPSVSVH